MDLKSYTTENEHSKIRDECLAEGICFSKITRGFYWQTD